MTPSTDWKANNPRYAAYFFGNGEKWLGMTDHDGDGTFEVNAPSGYPNVIFCRMNPSTTANNWDNKWNQTGDLSVPSTNKRYTVSGWGGGSWNTTYTVPTYHLPGSWDGDTWKQDENQLTLSGTDYVITKELTAGNYQFKISLNKKWDKSFGVSSTTYKDKLENVSLSGSSDIGITSLGGKYTFSYDSYENKLSVSGSLYTYDELMTKYYNEGSYVKETTLHVSTAAMAEIRDYFHNSAHVKYRKTTYEPGKLTMVTKATEDADWGTTNSTYQDIKNDNGEVTGIAHLKNGTQDYVVPNNVAGEDRSSLENWFVTLHDFKTSTFTGWSSEDGIHTFKLWNENGSAITEEQEEMKRLAREFVAPMWLNTTKAANYVTFDKLTVQEDNGALVMKLYVVSGNSGKLVSGANLVFSQAVIKKA